LYRTDDRVLLVHSDGAEPDPTIAFIEADEDGGTWDWGGSAMGGDCNLEVQTPRALNAVDWRLDPEAGPLTPESTVIHVLVSERECADGMAVGDRLRGPEVVVTDTHVLIAFGAEPDPGMHTCPDNPETPVAIELSGPIGDRVVADGTALDSTLGDFIQG
jgi:hypothetical protein